MRYEQDLTRSRRPIPVPEPADIAREQLQIDKIGRLIQDAELMQTLLQGDEYQSLIAMQKSRIIDIARQLSDMVMLEGELDVPAVMLIAGKLQEKFDMIDQLEAVTGWKAQQEEKRTGLAGYVKNLIDRGASRKTKE